jgi:hypothetical protein
MGPSAARLGALLAAFFTSLVVSSASIGEFEESETMETLFGLSDRLKAASNSGDESVARELRASVKSIQVRWFRGPSKPRIFHVTRLFAASSAN